MNPVMDPKRHQQLAEGNLGDIQVTPNPMIQSPTAVRASHIQELSAMQQPSKKDKLRQELSMMKVQMKAGLVSREQYDLMRRQMVARSPLNKIFGKRSPSSLQNASTASTDQAGHNVVEV